MSTEPGTWNWPSAAVSVPESSVADETSVPPEQSPWTIPLPSLVVFILLYLLAMVVPLIRIQTDPPGDYNWEAYTAAGLLIFLDNPTSNVLKAREGLMTNSGESAVVVGPMWLTTNLFGLTFGNMRIAMLAIAALAVPLTWLLGRLLRGDALGLGAAVGLATSQVFLLYGRTGTNVGMSLMPAVLTMIALWCCVDPGRRRWWLWLAALQVLLILNSYFYAPIRFLWLIAIILFLVEALMRRGWGVRGRFLLSAVITLGILPLVLPQILNVPNLSIPGAVQEYYRGRGEQIFTINDDQTRFVPFLKPSTEEQQQKLESESIAELTQRFVQTKAEDLGNLLIDHNTKPAITDYWNPQGRLYDRLLVPFFLLGMLLLLVRVFRSPQARFLLALFWGLSLPLLLTSNVHIGRLIFVTPLLALIVLWPVVCGIEWIGRNVSRRLDWLALVLCLGIATMGAIPSLQDWFGTPFRVERALVVRQTIDTTIQNRPSPQIAYVFGKDEDWEIERLRVASLRIQMGEAAQFVDLKSGAVYGDGPVRVLMHGLMERLQAPATVPGFCTNVYIIDEDLEATFLTLTTASALQLCGKPLTYQVP